MYIEPKFIVGKQFVTTTDSNTELTCIGYCNNQTFLVIGVQFDSVNNRSIPSTFKLSEVRFIGNVVPKP